jgi:hypothetical protein
MKKDKQTKKEDRHMNKKMTLGLVVMLGALNAAQAFNPGVYYYSNEQTKAERQMIHAKAASKAAKRYSKAARRHFKRTTAALNSGIKQHHGYRAYLAAQQEYEDSANRYRPYPEYAEDRGQVSLRYETSEDGFTRILK